jgi:hypothetical protein
MPRKMVGTSRRLVPGGTLPERMNLRCDLIPCWHKSGWAIAPPAEVQFMSLLEINFFCAGSETGDSTGLIN